MKVSFDIDCTPEEARRMLGLPDVTPVNEALVAELTKRAAEMAQNMDADKMMQQWMLSLMTALKNEQLQLQQRRQS